MLARRKPHGSAPLVAEPVSETRFPPFRIAANDEALFSALELLVVGIGEMDPPAVLRPGGRLARTLRLLFGIKAPAPFADVRLEALRSLAGALRHRRDTDAQIAAALGAGITLQQVEYLKTRG